MRKVWGNGGACHACRITSKYDISCGLTTVQELWTPSSGIGYPWSGVCLELPLSLTHTGEIPVTERSLFGLSCEKVIGDGSVFVSAA